ncbi:MAG TPA: UDP-N-acetylmuramoyl-L-alanyl-D-glutamate--2,6-diaminopimelate ligase [Chitinophagaceae bacterium]|nr:UDP-N-acetylmuramoyl-L-alanyl-D-glutamate--2,6-diaminopimelate ligase [Chitinophagaceae bacterium]
MTTLQNILYKTKLLAVQGNTNLPVSSIHIDSREVQAGSVFVAIKGVTTDGHQFIETAIQKGAIVIVCEQFPATIHNNITYIQVANAQEAVAYMAHQFYGEPSTKIKLVGVTGTNGKTTIATLLYQLFTALGYTCGLISTVQNHIGTEILPSTHTTPDAIQLNALLQQMLQAGCTHVFMECSSHAIHQHRITALQFTGALFSNITHDHLDYHKTFNEYIRVKKSFFDHLPSTAFAISNVDDKRGTVMLQNTSAQKYYYSLKTVADFKGRILENDLTGLSMIVNEEEVHFRMIGDFNAYNLLAVYGAAVCLGEDKKEVLRVLSTLTGAEGRFDYILSSKQKIIAIIDYAHTPDALKNVLATIQILRKNAERIITVVGCGGDRDTTKRPIMAEVAAALSDQVFITSDNPRSEDPQVIIQDMQAGLNSAGKRKTIAITDRKEAIKAAAQFAQAGDIILIAGKGHEKYQEIKGVKYAFDDKEVVREMFALMDK